MPSIALASAPMYLGLTHTWKSNKEQTKTKMPLLAPVYAPAPVQLSLNLYGKQVEKKSNC